jgi:hypothetical protein
MSDQDVVYVKGNSDWVFGANLPVMPGVIDDAQHVL